jgi:hypothetical protein
MTENKQVEKPRRERRRPHVFLPSYNPAMCAKVIRLFGQLVSCGLPEDHPVHTKATEEQK